MTDREAIRRLAVIVANLAMLRSERDSVYDLIREMDDAEPADPTVTREQAETAWDGAAAALLASRLATDDFIGCCDRSAFFRAVADALDRDAGQDNPKPTMSRSRRSWM